MMTDALRDGGYLFLGSRFKRLGERLQADLAKVVQAHGLPIQPSHYPLLARIEEDGPLTIGALALALGTSQPSITRAVGGLVAVGLVHVTRGERDQRQRDLVLTEAGRAAMALSRNSIWPPVAAAVERLCLDLDGTLLQQLDEFEDRVSACPLSRRIEAHRSPATLRLREFSDDLAGAFHDINVEWISDMFSLEQTDRDVLEQPRRRIVEPGGAILFAEAEGSGIVGTCALQKTGEGQFELTKMGVRQSARGLKAGEFLLHAAIDRARALGAERLYLLTNRKCAAAVHLYEKLGFVHSAEIMGEFGRRYARCDVAMLYEPLDQVGPDRRSPRLATPAGDEGCDA